MTPTGSRISKRIFSDRPERMAMSIIIAAHFIMLLAMGLARHWSYMTSLNDLGVYDQAVWGIVHGDWFHNTNNRFGVKANWLGFHFNPVLAAFAPLYLLWPAAEWFAIAQALALSIAAWPVFLLASRVSGSERTGVLWALVYLFNPFLISAAAWDFHPVTLAVPLIAAALLAVEMRNLRHLSTCCVLLLLVQEQFGLTVAGFGVLWAIRSRQWGNGLLLAGLGCLHTVLVLGVIMPALSPSGSHPFISGSGQINRYDWLGNSLGGIIGMIFTHPLRVVATIIGMPNSIFYLMMLSLPLLGMFLAAPLWLLPGLADFAANMLSSNTMPRGSMSYHSVTLVPVLTVAAIYGVRRLALRFKAYPSTRMLRYMICSTLILGYVCSPLPLPGNARFWAPTHVRFTPDPAINRLREIIGDDSAVSAQGNIAAHFSQRRQIYLFPERVDKSDFIVLRLDSPTSRFLPHRLGLIGTTSHHVQMDTTDYLASIEYLLHDQNFGVLLWEEPWLVFSHGATRGVDDQPIREKLHELRRLWKISDAEYAEALDSFSYLKP